ncbi:hypothetical protein EI94DRAFT_1703707 [Lactarius quietus]|nr:hypothetical protein EI94DRAFT_1703707 [Lactarius quietus]
MSQCPRSLCIQARIAKENNTPTGPPDAPENSEEGSAVDFMQHIPSPIPGAPPATGQVQSPITQSSGPLSAITISSSGPPSVPAPGLPTITTSGPPSDALPSTSGGQKCPAPYDFMDQIPASQRVTHNLPVQQVQPRVDMDEGSDDTTADNSIPDSEEDLIQVWGVPTSTTDADSAGPSVSIFTTDADSAGPSVRFTLPEGGSTAHVPRAHDAILREPPLHLPRRPGPLCSIPTNLLPIPSGAPEFNAALDAQAEVLHTLLMDLKDIKSELHKLTERLMRDFLIVETLIENMYRRP